MATVAVLLKQLRAARATFGAAAEQTQLHLLAQLATSSLTTPRQLIAYHEDLLFLIAFPGSEATRRRAARELGGFSRRWADCSERARRTADDSGIAGTVSRPPLAWTLAALLARDEAIDIDWAAVEDADALDALIARVVPECEEDAYASGHYSTRSWVDLARPRQDSALRWLVRSATSIAPQAGFAAAWNATEVPLAWSLHDSRRAITHARLRRRRVVQRDALRRLAEPAARHIERPLETIELLSSRDARRVIDLARSALAARCREVHAMNHGNAAEVHLADLGEGVELAVIGVTPPHRLLLEANYGYLLMSNGVPIGYGGVSPLFRQANTGINIFDAFRGSEAAFLWAQMLRAFRSLFGVRRFVINGYQFGAGNSEAIASGAYWFYYRLGFRPSRSAQARLAAAEAKRLARPHAPPTSRAQLRRLAHGDLHLDLADFRPEDAFDETALPMLGGALARRIAALPVHTQAEGERLLARSLAQALGLGSMTDWSAAERHGFRRLAPLVALADTSNWTPAERRDLAGWLRAKGAPVEREFALRAPQQAKLFSSLAAAGRRELDRLNE